MAQVDAECWFIWASVGAPVNTHDSTQLKFTDLWKRIAGGEMISNVVQQVANVQVPPLILGDRAFLLQTFILEHHKYAILPMKNDILTLEIAGQV